MSYKKEKYKVKQALEIIKLYFPKFKNYKVRCFNNLESMLKSVAKKCNISAPKLKKIYNTNISCDDILMVSTYPISVNLPNIKHVDNKYILFSLLHEIGHVELRHNYIDSTLKKVHIKIENQANNFAKKHLAIIEKKIKTVQQFMHCI